MRLFIHVKHIFSVTKRLCLGCRC